MADCALCSRALDDAAVVGTTSRFGHPARRVACAVCSLVQQCPMPTQGELGEYYSSHRYRDEHGPVTITARFPDRPTRRYEPGEPDYEDGLRMMAQYRHHWVSDWAGLVRGMRLLEIGSGDGFTLAEFAAQGLQCVGIEPDRDEAKASAERLPDGAKVHAGFYQDVDPGGPFDCVAAFHVLEHVEDPIQALRDWRQFLTPRGALIVEVPDVLDPGSPLDTNHWQWVHLYDFSIHTLKACLVQAGFEPVQIESRGGNLRSFSRPAAAPMQVEVPHQGQYVAGYLDRHREEERRRGIA